MSTQGRRQCAFDGCRRLAVKGSRRCAQHPGNHVRPAPAVPEPAGPVLVQPPGMTTEAATLWQEFAPRHEASGDAMPEDVTMLASYCEAVAAANRVREGLRSPIVKTTNGGVRVSPALAAWREATMTALKLAEHFGWTPLARSRMKADEQVDAPEDEGASLYGAGKG